MKEAKKQRRLYDGLVAFAKSRKPTKGWVVFLAMALIGTTGEMGCRAVSRDLVKTTQACPPDISLTYNFVCETGLRPESAAGWSTAWMLVIYGIGGVTLGYLNSWRAVARLPMAVQAALGGILCAAVEFGFGYVLNCKFHLNAWNYRGRLLAHLFCDQVWAGSIGIFCGVAPLAFWLDDYIGFMAYSEAYPGTPLHYYRGLGRWTSWAHAKWTHPNLLVASNGPFVAGKKAASAAAAEPNDRVVRALLPTAKLLLLQASPELWNSVDSDVLDSSSRRVVESWIARGAIDPTQLIGRNWIDGEVEATKRERGPKE